MMEDLAAFAHPPGVVPLCEDGALFEQVLKAMSSWDTVGPVRANTQGPLHIPRAGGARGARPRSSSRGARRARDHRSVNRDDRAGVKCHRLEIMTLSYTT